jgi:hypothetical protein
MEIDQDGTKKVPSQTNKAAVNNGIPDHLFKYEVEEVTS